MAAAGQERRVDASPGRAAQARTGRDAVFALAVLGQAAALVAWPRVVTVDGPAHLAGAAALLHRGSAAQSLYEVDLWPLPNLLTSVLLAALLGVLGPDGAERLLVLAYALGLPLAMRYALRGVDPSSGWQAVAVVPFVGGYLYTYGFYNLCLALVGMLLVAGLALRQRSGWSRRSTFALSLLLVLTWTAHLLPLLVAGLLVAVLALCRAWSARRDGLREVLLRHLAPVVLAGLPVLALTVAYLLDPASGRGEPVRTSSPPGLLLGLVGLGRPLVAWTTWEYVGSGVVAAGLLALVLAGRPLSSRSPERRALAVTGLLLTAAYLASPDRYGPAYGFLNDRLSLFPPLLLVLWAAAPAPSTAARAVPAARAALLLLLTGTVLLIGARLPTDLRYQREVAEFVSVAPAVPRGSTLVALRLSRATPVGPDARNRARDPLRHQAGRVAVLTGGVDVGDYQAVTAYFPTRWRPATDPRRRLDPDLQGLERVPPRVDLTAGPQVVLVVGRARADSAALQAPETVRVLAELATSYRRTAVSRRGLVEVWQRR